MKKGQAGKRVGRGTFNIQSSVAEALEDGHPTPNSEWGRGVSRRGGEIIRDEVGRVTPCAPRPRHDWRGFSVLIGSGAHGVTRPTFALVEFQGRCLKLRRSGLSGPEKISEGRRPAAAGQSDGTRSEHFR